MAERLKTVRVPLHHETLAHVSDFSRASGQSKTDYIVDALFMGVTLKSTRVSDGVTPFEIDGRLFTPPEWKTFSADRTLLVELESRDRDLAAKHATSAHKLSLGVYMARCTALMNEMYTFGLEEESLVTRGDDGFQVVSLAPFEWDSLSEQS